MLSNVYKLFYNSRWCLYFFIIFFVIYDDLQLINVDIKFYWFISLFLLYVFIFHNNYIIKNIIIPINVFLLKYFPIILKLRLIFFNLPLFIEMIMLNFIWIDRFLRIILFLDNNKYNFFYFIRSFVYHSILLWLCVPFHLILNYYKDILELINALKKDISLLNFIYNRINFIFLTITFLLLFNISRVEWVILLWILDELINLYYDWYIMFLSNISPNLGNINKWKNYTILLTESLSDSDSYFNFLDQLGIVRETRISNLLIYKGLSVSDIPGFVFLDKIYNYFFLNFLGYSFSKAFAECYYLFTNDQIKLRFISLIVKKWMYADFHSLTCEMVLKKMNNLAYIGNMYEYREIYNLLCKIIDVLQNNEDLFNEVEKLYERYKDTIWLQLNELDIQEFIKKFNKYM